MVILQFNQTVKHISHKIHVQNKNVEKLRIPFLYSKTVEMYQ